MSQSRTLRSPAEFYRVEVDGFRVDIHPSMKTMTYPWTWATVEVHLGHGLPSNFLSGSRAMALSTAELKGARVSSGIEFDVHIFKGDQPELTSYPTGLRKEFECSPGLGVPCRVRPFRIRISTSYSTISSS